MKNTRSIKENHVFRTLYARGKSAACRTMVLYARKHRDGAVNQLGITVSVKLGCAVVRNRCRRRLKEAFGTVEGNLRPGHCIVLVARSACLEADFKALCAEMEKAFTETGVL